MKKTVTVKPPSVQSIQLVLQAAEAAPRPNGPVSRQLDAAVMEVDQFFTQLLAPPQSPQASAIAGGKASDQA